MSLEYDTIEDAPGDEPPAADETTLVVIVEIVLVSAIFALLVAI